MSVPSLHIYISRLFRELICPIFLFLRWEGQSTGPRTESQPSLRCPRGPTSPLGPQGPFRDSTVWATCPTREITLTGVGQQQWISLAPHVIPACG